MTHPQDGTTPSAPDVDQPDGGAHDGAADSGAGRAPSAPDVDEPEGGAHGGTPEQ